MLPQPGAQSRRIVQQALCYDFASSRRVGNLLPARLSKAPRGQEPLAFALLLLLGLIPRIAFVALFPVRPVSDFHNLVGFALQMRDVSWTAPSWHWIYFSPGLPLALSLVLRLFPGPPDDVARTATAVVCGLTPLLPFALWRGVASFRVRLLAGTLLALWPGQVFFSGVVAQDNWVLPPTVALACLAARALLAGGRGRPVLAGLLYALAVAMRQEMLVALFPLLLAGAGLGSGEERRWRNAAACALAAALPLLLLATQRELATGRFALTSEHAGISVLGAYVPGAAANAWADPRPFLASVRPALLQDPDRLRREAGGLALDEALRRPAFHAVRIASTVLSLALDGEAANLYWSVLIPGGLPEPLAPRGQRFAAHAKGWLATELAVLQALFLAAVILALAWRQRAILALCAAIALKVGLHAVTVSQGRYLLPVTAMEILVIALAVEAALLRRRGRLPAAALACGAAAVFAFSLLVPRATEWVQRHDDDPQRTYRFTLEGPAPGAALACVVDRGLLMELNASRAVIAPLHADPAPGEAATARCELTGTAAVPLALRLLDAYAPGDLPDRMRQRVEIDGVAVLDHDLAAAPGEGWHSVPLGADPPGAPRRILIQVTAVRPDPGAAWGRAAATPFELATAEEKP
jgi:hypothetical protein